MIFSILMSIKQFFLHVLCNHHFQSCITRCCVQVSFRLCLWFRFCPGPLLCHRPSLALNFDLSLATTQSKPYSSVLSDTCPTPFKAFNTVLNVLNCYLTSDFYISNCSRKLHTFSKDCEPSQTRRFHVFFTVTDRYCDNHKTFASCLQTKVTGSFLVPPCYLSLPPSSYVGYCHSNTIVKLCYCVPVLKGR